MRFGLGDANGVYEPITVCIADQNAHRNPNIARNYSIAYANETDDDCLRIGHAGEIHRDLIARDAEVAQSSNST